MDRFKQALINHRLSEFSGIFTAFLMTVASCVPVFTDHDPHQIAIVTFFFVVFSLRLVLFLVNRKVKGTVEEQHVQAVMMLISAIILLLLHTVSLAAITYQLISSGNVPLMASTLPLAIVYGVYAVVKIVFSVRSMISKRKKDFYEATLYSINWITAIYTLALFTNYLLIVRESPNFMMPRYIMIAILGLTSINLAFAMLKKSIRFLRTKPLQE